VNAFDDDSYPYTSKGAFSTIGIESEWHGGSRAQATAVATNAWTSGLAVYVPFLLVDPLTVGRAHWVNGVTVAGNFEVAWWNAATSSKLWTTGSVAQSGASAIQGASAAAVTLGSGRFICMIAGSSTGQLHAHAVSSAFANAYWVRQQTGVTLPVATATPVQATGTPLIPIITFTDGDSL
jgi:hypothetical protein